MRTEDNLLERRHKKMYPLINRYFITSSVRTVVHKFVDDTTLSEIIPNDDVSHTDAFLVDIIRWSQDNLMRVNWNKTKEMLLG